MSKILIGKLGLDGHDKGAKLLCKFLKDSGYEVIYSGIRQTPEFITKIASHEDVDLIGISILSGAHLTLIPQLLQELNKINFQGSVIVGGIIPAEDAEYLEAIGVSKVFFNTSSFQEIEKYLHEII